MSDAEVVIVVRYIPYPAQHLVHIDNSTLAIHVEFLDGCMRLCVSVQFSAEAHNMAVLPSMRISSHCLLLSCYLTYSRYNLQHAQTTRSMDAQGSERGGGSGS